MTIIGTANLTRYSEICQHSSRMAASVTRDVEALVDLFLSPTFDPFEPESSATCTGDRRPGALNQMSVPPPPPPQRCLEAPPVALNYSLVSGRQTGDRRPGALNQMSVPPPPPPQRCLEVDDEGDGVEYEAAVASDTEDEIEEENIYVQPGILSEQTKQCGQILAKMGDEFFKSYTPSQSSTSAASPWSSIGEQLKSIFSKLSQIKDTDPDAEQKKEEGWRDFKAILNSAVSDNVVGDAFKLLGALLLSLHGLAGMVSGIKGLARTYFIRYIRERELDVEMQRLGGLNHLMQQELD